MKIDVNSKNFDPNKLSFHEWIWISEHQELSEEFIEKNSDKVNWVYISIYQVLSEPFIEKNSDKVNWDNISIYQVLSEPFIEKNKDKVDWFCISKYQKLSEPFIEKNKDKVDWDNISEYQVLSKDFVRKYNFVDYVERGVYSDGDKILSKFKVKNGYVYGYKAVRRDRYSKFNFQYQYLDGNTYESNADKTNAENSFGLSIGTLKYAKDYATKNDIILEVRCKLEDIAKVVHCGTKIRAYKMEVLNQYIEN